MTQIKTEAEPVQKQTKAATKDKTVTEVEQKKPKAPPPGRAAVGRWNVDAG